MRPTPVLKNTCAALLIAAACAAQPRQVALRLDEPVDVTWDDGAAIGLLWREVEDSRCPADVVCVWEGQVTVRLEVNPQGGGEEVTLTWQYEGDERATAATGGFRIRLEGVDPYPTAAVPTERADYAARLTVAPPGAALPVQTAVATRTWGQVKTE